MNLNISVCLSTVVPFMFCRIVVGAVKEKPIIDLIDVYITLITLNAIATGIDQINAFPPKIREFAKVSRKAAICGTLTIIASAIRASGPTLNPTGL